MRSFCLLPLLLAAVAAQSEQMETCPPCSHWESFNLCVCDQGCTVINGACAPSCPSNSQWDGTACACDPNYFLLDGKCLPLQPSSCPPHSHWGGSKCDCDTGYQQVNNDCIIKCPANSHSTGSTCMCDPGYQMVNSACVKICRQICKTCVDSQNCLTCYNGYSLMLFNGRNGDFYDCVVTRPSVSVLKLANRAISSDGSLYQGVTLNQIPSDFQILNCKNCDKILLVKAASSTSFFIKVTHVIKTNKFVIRFAFSPFQKPPRIEFTVQINPVYSSSFTPVDMSQKLSAIVEDNNYPKIPAPTYSNMGSFQTFTYSVNALNVLFKP